MLLKIKSNNFIRNLSKLILGGVAAQIITLGCTIFIVRLFTVEAFGEYAIVISLAQILPIVLSLRYELSLMNAGSDHEAYVTTVAILFVVLILSIFGAMLVYLIGPTLGLPAFLFDNIEVIRLARKRLYSFN